jgi:hypothetical protein
MSLSSLLASLKGKRKNPFPQAKHVIKHAFCVGGVDYFEFDTTANLPWKRGLKFLSVYNEMDMKCDRYYLLKHTEAVENILTQSKKIGLDEIIKIKQLNNQLKERLTWVYHEDLVYKIASIVFFDANENPDDWEWKYALNKIEFWKKHEDAGAFFLHEPITRLIPFLNASEATIRDYSAVQKKMDLVHLENIFSNMWANPKSDSVSYTQRYFAQEMKQSSKV